MVRNLIRYRSKGGVFRTPESLKRIYGMTDSLYQTLEPYITIGPDFQHRDTLPWKTAPGSFGQQVVPAGHYGRSPLTGEPLRA